MGKGGNSLCTLKLTAPDIPVRSVALSKISMISAFILAGGRVGFEAEVTWIALRPIHQSERAETAQYQVNDRSGFRAASSPFYFHSLRRRFRLNPGKRRQNEKSHLLKGILGLHRHEECSPPSCFRPAFACP